MLPTGYLGETLKETIRLFVFICYFCLIGVSGVDVVSVTEGESVTLLSSVTTVQKTDGIRWKFGADGALIALVDKNHITLFNGSDGRFRDKLQLDQQTASLTINNITKTHAGPYQLTINKGQSIPDKKFNLTVYSRLPAPDIIFNSSQCSSSSSMNNCTAVCSVLNVSAVSLSWYKGNSLLSSISVSDLSSSISLPLVVEYQDKNNYSCVINNTISNQTTHLNISKNTEQTITVSPHSFSSVSLILPLSAAVGCLILALLVIFCICMKQRKTDQKVETRAEEITYADPTFHRGKAPKTHSGEVTYADPTFYKRKAKKPSVQEEPDVVYAGVAVRR